MEKGDLYDTYRDQTLNLSITSTILQSTELPGWWYIGGQENNVSGLVKWGGG